MKHRKLTLGMLMTAAALIPVFASATTGTDDSAGAEAVRHYLAIQSALAHDSLDGVSGHAAAFGALAEAAAPTDHNGTAIAAAANRLARSQDLGEARRCFGDLSLLLLEDEALIPADGLKVAYCPMAEKHWLQAADAIENPYYGSQMFRCGVFVERPESAGPPE
ncbi:MAG TPA: hypothetical protein P5571_00820 [Candidatus Krumholzibacteria bacterium]|nr:hypothetical protein [Candidatus Krumholzibacteria bacterium]HRX49897.1 hypothetical protein [Candidatus Krumholzibacteria bacterium]